MTDRGKGQERLQVMLEERDDRAHHHRDQPRRGHNDHPFRGARQDRPHARHQKNARLHHGGGVQIGRNRCRGRHRVRQPEMERELRRFGETAQQDQDQGGDIKRICLDQLAVLQDDAQVVTAHDLAQDQHAANHREAPHTGDRQRHARPLAAFGQMLPIADQQERRQRGQLPENQQKQDVIGQYNAHHRALKKQQVGKELPHIVVTAQIVATISDDQQANAKDQKRKEKAQPIQHQGKVEAQHRHPVNAGGHHLSGKDGGQVGQQSDKGRQRHGKGDPRCGRAAGGIHQSGQQRAEKRKGNDKEEGHGRS
mmetsp:Transcript_28482/g.53385  ORF Transcript_28482/g.53385 Transcript_28482/m.53385 type:complete len:310 (-) Transcript_28482:2207-3136(-)